MLIEGKKFACAACIKGHRSSSCQHGDRPVYEIKKKGRPPTQCPKCRQLRKQTGMHQRCTCNVDSPEGSSSEPKPAGPNFKAHRAIHRATVQRAFKCLKRGNCACGGHRNTISVPSTSGSSLDEHLASTLTPTSNSYSSSQTSDTIATPPPTSALNGLNMLTSPLKGDLTDTAHVRATEHGNDSANGNDWMMPGPSLNNYLSNMFPLLQPTDMLSSDTSLFKTDDATPTPVYVQNDSPSLSLADGNGETPKNTDTPFQDWVFGDILVPEDMFAHQATSSAAPVQGGCAGCGPGCLCGTDCQCAHVKEVEDILLSHHDFDQATSQSTSSVDVAFYESIFGPQTDMTITDWQYGLCSFENTLPPPNMSDLVAPAPMPAEPLPRDPSLFQFNFGTSMEPFSEPTKLEPPTVGSLSCCASKAVKTSCCASQAASKLSLCCANKAVKIEPFDM